jgi:hypothetical protein
MKSFLRVFVVAICVLLPLSSVAQNQRSEDDRRPNQGYGFSHDRWQGRLSTEDQSRFDSYYSRWLNYVQTNDRENRNSMEDRMRDVMSHYNIPSDVPFDQIASNNIQGYGVHRRPDQEGINYDRGQLSGRAACQLKTNTGSTLIIRAGWTPGRPETGTRLPAWKSACWS